MSIGDMSSVWSDSRTWLRGVGDVGERRIAGWSLAGSGAS